MTTRSRPGMYIGSGGTGTVDGSCVNWTGIAAFGLGAAGLDVAGLGATGLGATGLGAADCRALVLGATGSGTTTRGAADRDAEGAAGGRTITRLRGMAAATDVPMRTVAAADGTGSGEGSRS